jgi:hypothetical protein
LLAGCSLNRRSLNWCWLDRYWLDRYWLDRRWLNLAAALQFRRTGDQR